MSETKPKSSGTDEMRKQISLWTAGIFTVIGLAFFGYSAYTLFFIQQGRGDLSDTVLQPVTILMFVVSTISFFLIRRNRFTLGIWLLVLVDVSLPPILAVLVLRNIYPIAVTYLITLTALLAFLIFQRASRWQVLTVAALTILVIIGIELWNPAFRGTSANLTNFTTGVIILAALGFLAFFIRLAWRGSLRTKFLASILLMVGSSIAAFSVFAVYSSSQTQTFMIDQLQSAVRSQSKLQLNDTVQTKTHDAEVIFDTVVQEVQELADYQEALYTQSSTLKLGAYWDGNTRLSKLSGGQYGNSQSDGASVFIPSTVTLDEAIIADLNTNIYMDFTAPAVLKSNPNIVAVYFIGTDGSTIYYPNINLAGIVPPDFDPRLRPFYSIATPEKNPERKVVWTDPYQDAAGNGLLVTSVAPIYDQAGKFRGVVAADVQLIDITANVSAIKIGQSGFAFMVDSSGHIIGMPDAGYKLFNLTPEVVPTDETPKQVILGIGPEDFQAATRKMVAGEAGLETIDIQGQQYYVSYTPLPSVGYSLGIVAPVIELDAPYLTARDQVQSNTQGANRLFFIILIVILLAAAGASLLLSQFLSGPIVRLTRVAEQVTAGDMEVQAKVESADEIGTLAGAFNRMTAQLREFISSLESRVAERTRNLELAAEVGHTVSQVRTLDVMLKDAAEIIRSRFNLYYVQVYLTDPSQTNLTLQSGTGKVGAELLGRGHKLPLNTASINGRAAIERRSVVVADTTASATFKPNPLLPNTRSEMAVPLLVGEKVVGVLDMQSEHAGSLSEDVLSAFEALAGQLAIAIQNANLLAETEKARAEVESQARRLTRTNWMDYLDAIHKPEETGFLFEQNKISVLTQAEETQTAENSNALVAPIAVTGEALGNLIVEMEGQSPISRTSELVNTVARQVAQQIESLRLLDSAERYRFEAEQASRRLTREGWKDYTNANADKSLSYIYDLKEVRTYNQDDDQQAEEPALSLPLKVRDETVGKLVVQGLGSDAGESFDLANAVAERLGAHIESLRLSQQTEQVARREHALRQITSAVRGSTDPATILRAAVRELGTLLGRKTVIRLETAREAQDSRADRPADVVGEVIADNGNVSVSPAESPNADGGNE